MNSYKNSAAFLGRSCRAVRGTTLRHRLGSSLPLPLLLLALAVNVRAQVNSGSDGHDGAFNPTTNTVINMADHPDGIYHYTSVFIPTNVTVSFIPNANNTPVTWLVQSNVVINGTVDVSGKSTTNSIGALGGPGGWAGGSGGSNPTPGQGPGGGSYSTNNHGGFGSFGTSASSAPFCGAAASGQVYGNSFLIPLMGGSGGGGSRSFGCNYSGYSASGGGGGGGAIVIAASGLIAINGLIVASGGSGIYASSGSGGAIRLIAATLTGTGSISAAGPYPGGNGRIRFDTLQNSFGGSLGGGVFTSGYQPIIIPTAGQGAQLTVTSVGGVPVSASPTGVLSTPDAVVSAQQNNPIPIVVRCSNIPLNTQITVSVRPANGATVSATGLNNTGTLTSSTATVLINMPRGGGIIYATAAN